MANLCACQWAIHPKVDRCRDVLHKQKFKQMWHYLSFSSFFLRSNKIIILAHKNLKSNLECKVKQNLQNKGKVSLNLVTPKLEEL